MSIEDLIRRRLDVGHVITGKPKGRFRFDGIHVDAEGRPVARFSSLKAKAPGFGYDLRLDVLEVLVSHERRGVPVACPGPFDSMRQRRPEREAEYLSAACEKLHERLSHNVLRLRKARRWTQEEAAHQTEMSTRLLQRIEAGETNVTLTTLARLVEGFGVDVLDLFRRPRTR